jgi:hypothetical protein
MEHAREILGSETMNRSTLARLAPRSFLNHPVLSMFWRSLIRPKGESTT